MYGRGAASLAAKELDCDVWSAEVYLNNWWSRYPAYKRWSDSIKRTLVECGEVKSLSGRKRRYRIVTGQDHKVFTQGVNFPVQALASDITLSSLIELHHVLKPYDSYVLFGLHDSIVFEVSKRHLDIVCKLIHDIMTRPRFDGVSGIPIEMKIGPRWGECKEYDFRASYKDILVKS